MNHGSKEKELVRKYEQSIADADYTPTAPANMQDYTFGGWFDNQNARAAPMSSPARPCLPTISRSTPNGSQRPTR